MKYLKEYSEEDLTDLASDLKSIGQSDWMGFYITYVVNGDDAVGTTAVAVIEELAYLIEYTIILTIYQTILQYKILRFKINFENSGTKFIWNSEETTN